MDFAEPLQALIPGATGRVLGVLVHTAIPLSGRAIAQLAGVSSAQAARVLPRLVELGLVKSRSSPPAILYEFMPDHIAAEPLLLLSGLDLIFLEQLGEDIALLRPTPACAAVFGSFARRQGRIDSDIDLLLVRPKAVAEDDEGWRQSVDAIRMRAQRLSGNGVEILEVGQDEVRSLIRGTKPLWRNIVRDALVVHGRPLHEL